jgi:trehalose synthase
MSVSLLDRYGEVAGAEVIDHLRQLAAPLQGLRIVHVNSTREGGGVAEILHKMVPFMEELGLEASWEVIQGDASFYDCTKRFHNALQGDRVDVPRRLLEVYESTNADQAEALRPALEDADVVIIHDPQPAALLPHFPQRKGKWVWRCHIDASHPHRPVWKYLRDFVLGYDASIFSLPDFAQSLPHPQYIISPSIDPLSEKNIDLTPEEVAETAAGFDLDPERPTILQVSRFDRFKDPLGVIEAFHLVRQSLPRLQLVLAGGAATDDPEGAQVLAEVQEAADGEPDIHVLLLPPDAHRTINALQRYADLVFQKSIREGFGLTVAEAMWKSRPVIGGDTGGIRLQVVNHHTGFLVNTPEGAALRTRYLLSHREILHQMGRKARSFVRENFLLTRHLVEYLVLIHAISGRTTERIELSSG